MKNPQEEKKYFGPKAKYREKMINRSETNLQECLSIP
jgi:hypothetical protein